MSELNQEYTFHPADLIEYVIDKPIGAVRAALLIALKDSDVHPDFVICNLSDTMELNQQFLQQLSRALRKNQNKIIDEMPAHIRTSQLEYDLGLL